MGKQITVNRLCDIEGYSSFGGDDAVLIGKVTDVLGDLNASISRVCAACT